MRSRNLVSLVVGVLVVAPAAVAVAQQQEQQQSQPQPAQSGGASGTRLQIASDSLVGSKVRDRQGKEIGEVSKLMIDPQQGKVTHVVISQGGTLGVGAKEVAVPWDAVQVARDDQQRLVVTLQQEMLQQAPKAEQQRQQQSDQPAASPPTSEPKKQQ